MTFIEIAQLITALAALLSCILSWANRGKITHVQLLINSRMTQLLEVTKDAAHLAGEAAQRAKEVDKK